MRVQAFASLPRIRRGDSSETVIVMQLERKHADERIAHLQLHVPATHRKTISAVHRRATWCNMMSIHFRRCCLVGFRQHHVHICSRFLWASAECPDSGLGPLRQDATCRRVRIRRRAQDEERHFETRRNAEQHMFHLAPDMADGKGRTPASSELNFPSFAASKRPRCAHQHNPASHAIPLK